MDKEINNNGYEYVDLGLPSGTLWATCNVGAKKPTDYGFYFQWGDIVGYTKDQVGIRREQKMFSTNCCDYKWGVIPNFTKYIAPNDKLELEDDAAHVNMGGDWHMPSSMQLIELYRNTIREWTTLDGVNGMTFTSKKDESKFIFIPAAGYAWGCSVDYSEDCGYVWSSMISTDCANYGHNISFNPEGYCLDDGSRRDCGFSVRGVIDKKVDKHKEKKSNMNENLDLTKILKYAPKGTELWSPIYGKCTFLEIDENGYDKEHSEYPIACEADGVRYDFTKEGKLFEDYNDTECVLFPSKENRDWSTFKVQKPHKHFEPFQKVLVGLIMDGKQIWTRDVYMYYRKDIHEHCTVFESMVSDDLIIPYDFKKDGKPVKKVNKKKKYEK